MDSDFDLESDRTNPSAQSEPFVDASSSEAKLDSESVHSISPSDNSTALPDVGTVGGTDVKNDSALVEGNGSDATNRKAEGLKKLKVVRNRKNDSEEKGKRKAELKSKETRMVTVYDSMFDEVAGNGSVVVEDGSPRSSNEVSPVHGFEVEDMVWGKVKSHPWWPGHIFSEEFANPSVRRSKRDGLLLVAFFGDSSYGWFDPSELIPFDANFAEKSRQTSSKTFVRAVEEAVDEVSRRSALGLSCMCRSKQNFRPTDVEGYFAVDVADYEPEVVYSIDAIRKARDSFQPTLALDFVRQLALEPTGAEPDRIDFIKNKANVVSYRRAVYEEFDDTYAQAFGQDPDHSSPGSIPESVRKTPSKAPLSGRQVFADTSGKGKSSAKPNKPKENAKKDKYILKRRDESKQVIRQKEKGKAKLSPKPGHVEDGGPFIAGDYVLQKRVSSTEDDLPSKDSTGTGASTENTPVVLEFGDPGIPTVNNKVDDDDDKKIMSQMEDRSTSTELIDEKKASSQNNIPNSEPHKTVGSERPNNGPKKMKVSKRPIGEVGSGKPVSPVRKKKKLKEQLIPVGKSMVPLEDKEKVSAKKLPESAQTADNKPIDSSSSNTPATKEMTGVSSSETELPRVLGDLFTLARDPLQAIKRGKVIKTRRVFLKFRSLVFQKSLNVSPPADDEGNDTHSGKSSDNGLAIKPVKLPGRPDDPTKGGRKRGPSDRQEEMAARKKKKVDIKNLTKEKKLIKRTDEPHARDVKQVVTTVKKSGHVLDKKTENRVPDRQPTMLMIKFPQGGSLPSHNELKARFARFGPMDHSATRVFWKTFTCRVVYHNKSSAQAAYRFVIGSSNLFGNTGVKCSLKDVGNAGSTEPDPAVKIPKEDNQETMEDRLLPIVPASPVQLKSILKKSGGDDSAGNGGKGRVKFMLGGEESQMENKNGAASSFSSTTTSHATMDINSKNFQKGVLPLPNSSLVASSTSQFNTRPQPPPNSMHSGTPLAQPPLLPPPPPRSLNYSEMAKPTPTPPLRPPPGNFVHNLQRPNIGPPKVDISQQMLSLLTKCNEVVSNVSNVMGYVPYHPL
ncbi:PWWP domain-containing protein 1-like [Rutidosis leptorrhynchoides]|uniref:PWWP domain-containing protein 1-like n=1 Tax=Rutidosis leptorrhynchoides TaxID=125765 RepID=UPI003A9A351F